MTASYLVASWLITQAFFALRFSMFTCNIMGTDSPHLPSVDLQSLFLSGGARFCPFTALESPEFNIIHLVMCQFTGLAACRLMIRVPLLW